MGTNPEKQFPSSSFEEPNDAVTHTSAFDRIVAALSVVGLTAAIVFVADNAKDPNANPDANSAFLYRGSSSKVENKPAKGQTDDPVAGVPPPIWTPPAAMQGKEPVDPEAVDPKSLLFMRNSPEYRAYIESRKVFFEGDMEVSPDHENIRGVVKALTDLLLLAQAEFKKGNTENAKALLLFVRRSIAHSNNGAHLAQSVDGAIATLSTIGEIAPMWVLDPTFRGIPNEPVLSDVFSLLLEKMSSEEEQRLGRDIYRNIKDPYMRLSQKRPWSA